MREIEIKAIVTDLGKLEKELELKNATYTKEKKQIDTIYLPIGKSYEDLTGVNILRIRKEDSGKEKITFNLKRHLSNELDCIEHETEISSPDSVDLLVKELGFYEAIKVIKYRRSGKIGKYSFNLDEVDGLGSFIELEALIDDSDDSCAEEIQKMMSNVLENLMIPSKNIVILSYDTELYNRTKK